MIYGDHVTLKPGFNTNSHIKLLYQNAILFHFFLYVSSTALMSRKDTLENNNNTKNKIYININTYKGAGL